MTDKATSSDAGANPSQEEERSVGLDHHFVQRFTVQVPHHIAATFTDEQMRGVVQAFGVRRWVKHKLDVRFTFRALGRTWYVVMLGGVDRRPRDRNRLEGAAHPVVTAGNIMFLFMVSAIMAVLALGLLYLLKSAVGLDLFPGASLGLWSEVQTVIRGPK